MTKRCSKQYQCNFKAVALTLQDLVVTGIILFLLAEKSETKTSYFQSAQMLTVTGLLVLHSKRSKNLKTIFIL